MPANLRKNFRIITSKQQPGSRQQGIDKSGTDAIRFDGRK